MLPEEEARPVGFVGSEGRGGAQRAAAPGFRRTIQLVCKVSHGLPLGADTIG